MAIIKQRNTKTGVTYVYESHSYRDKETKQPRAKRKLIGRLDEVTGEIVPTRKKSKNITTPPDNSVDIMALEGSASYSALLDSIKEKEEVIKSLRREIAGLKRERRRLSEELLRLGQKLQS